MNKRQEEKIQIFLSKFFNENTQVIANMCPKCYDECPEVKITGLNLKFLKQLQNAKSYSREDFNDGFKGFSIYDDQTIYNNSRQSVKNLSPHTVNDTDNTKCKGFSQNEAKKSFLDYQILTKLINSLRYDIYKNVNRRILKTNDIKRHLSIFFERSSSEIFSANQETNDPDPKPTVVKIVKIRDDTQEEYTKIRQLGSPSSITKGSSRVFEVKNKESNPAVSVIIDNESYDPSQDKIEGTDSVMDHCSNFSKNNRTSQLGGSSLLTVMVKEEYSSSCSVEESNLKSVNFAKRCPAFLQAKKEDNLPHWKPPRSPHNLIEEVLYYDPWSLLVATIFLNKTSCKTARPYVFWFLKDHSDPFSVLSKKPYDLEKYFVNLGLQKTRSVQVWRMSHDFLYKNWRKPTELYGVGRYGEEAFRIFCLGDFNFEPKDRFLRIYKAWYEMEERKLRIEEMNR